MSDHWDLILEKVHGDTWWMPPHVIQINREDIAYTYDPKGDDTFSVVHRVNNSLKEYHSLVDEVITHHQPTGESAWALSAVSTSSLLTSILDESGYTLNNIADGWTISVDTPRPPLAEIEVKRITTLAEMQDQNKVMHRCFDRYKLQSEEVLKRNLAQTVDPQARCQRFVAYDRKNGEPLATSNINFFHELGLGFMWGGSTVPEARGRGVYTALVTARMQVARSLGIQRIGLYALRETSAPIIEKQGFEKHGSMEFWIQDFA